MSSDILPTAQNAEVPTDNKATQELLVLRENHQFDYSMAMLAAQERDRQAEREHLQSFCRASNRNWVIAGCFVLAIMMASFWMGKEQFLLECQISRFRRWRRRRRVRLRIPPSSLGKHFLTLFTQSSSSKPFSEGFSFAFRS